MQDSDDRRSAPSAAIKSKLHSSGGGSDPSEKQPLVDLSSKPCKVAEIQLKGLKKTNPEIIHRELDLILKAQNLQEIYDEIQDLIPKLSALDVFSTMDVHITETKQNEAERCRLEFEFTEKQSWHAKAKTFVQGTEAGIEGRFGLRNVRGRAEKVILSVDYGSHKTMESALEYIQPRFLGSPIEFAMKVFNSSKSNSHFSAYDEALKGLNFALLSPSKHHRLSYECGWQQLLDPQFIASPPVQQQLGNTIKSSLNYQFLYDPRPVRHLSTGFAYRWSSQLNGLFPNVSNTKSLRNKMDFQISCKVLPWASLALGASTGLVVPLSKDYLKSTTNLNERFYLGGVDSLKGFHLNSIGPTALRRPSSGPEQKRDYLGGDVLCSAYASLNVFGRNRPNQPMGIHGHLFANVGNVAPLGALLDAKGALKENLRSFGMDYRASMGVGLVLPTPLGNFEVNYAIPLRFSTNDSIRSGLQMSFGTDPFTV